MDLDSSHSETPLMTIQKGENTIAVKTRQTYTLQTDIQKSTECLETFFFGFICSNRLPVERYGNRYSNAIKLVCLNYYCW